MYTIEQAKSKVNEYIEFLNLMYNETFPDIEFDVKIIENQTKEYDFGWVFFYQSLNEESRLGGNGPLIIEKDSLDIYEMMTAISVEENIKLYLEDKNKLGLLKKPDSGIWDSD
ncbi:hypothetical protein [Olleya sp. ITB9]|uniref:hypothetical protein n=1 Tax=Olleya sp. ITB9 TaxID=1715648 RepID=UPI0006D12DEA|nr:hypothetical protein [Olleya sp. ITB9]